jgi:hypothetical protein
MESITEIETNFRYMKGDVCSIEGVTFEVVRVTHYEGTNETVFKAVCELGYTKEYLKRRLKSQSEKI